MIDKAIEQLGLTGLAKAIGITPQAVWKWRESNRVPAERCRAIEIATEGKVTCHDLRPDIFGPAPSRAPRKKAA